LSHFKCAEEVGTGTGVGVGGSLPEVLEVADVGVFFTILAQDDIW